MIPDRDIRTAPVGELIELLYHAAAPERRDSHGCHGLRHLAPWSFLDGRPLVVSVFNAVSFN